MAITYVTLLEAYQWTLKELDKWESPTMETTDFNYHFDSAIEEYLSNQLPSGEVVQKESDDIDGFIVFGEALDAVGGAESTFTLPDAYRHVWAMEAVVRFKADEGKYSKDDEVTVYPKRRRANRRGYQEDNAYQRPSIKYPLWRRITSGTNKQIKVLAGDNLECISCTLDYVKEFPKLALPADASKDIKLPAYVVREIVKLTARKFIENIESPRYQSQLQELQLRNE